METFNICVTEQELNIIYSALQEKPFKEVANLIQTLSNQYQYQIQERQTKAEAENEDNAKENIGEEKKDE